MISSTLMKQTIKSNFTLWVIITAVLALCLGAMSAMGGTVEASGIAFYNMLPGLISAIYVIITANKLIASQVDRGTMAYIVSTPTKRSQVAFTQAAYFIGSLLLMFTITAATHILCYSISTGGISGGDVQKIIFLNLGLFLLDLALSGICFLASCWSNLSKYAIAIGGGILGVFHLASMMTMFGNDFGFLKDVTIVSLYDITSIFAESSTFIYKFGILAVIGVVTYVAGTSIFVKKDLPL